MSQITWKGKITNLRYLFFNRKIPQIFVKRKNRITILFRNLGETYKSLQIEQSTNF